LLALSTPPQQSERFRLFERGPALCDGAKFGMVY
jgi:hypothetical protein